MDQEDSDPKFRDLLPTLRAYYAYLKCGHHILMKVFLWIQQLQDIPNVEKYLIDEFGMTNNDYRKYFTSTTRENFKNNGIRKIDITAIFRMHNTVNGFFKDTVQPWSELEYLLTQIKDERNEIMHNLLMKDKIQDEEQLRDYLNSCGNHMENVIRAFQDQFGGYASEQQRMEVKEFVKNVIDEVKTQINEDNVNIAIQHHGTGDINVPEDIATNLFQQIFSVAGQRGSLSIQHFGSGNINISQEFYNVTGGNATFNI